MRIRVVREPSIDKTTLGVVFVDGHFFAFSLEDAIRERPGEPVASWKVPGETAIPAGTYAVRVTWSPRFERPLPEIVDVPGFDGIRIHPGNRREDTDGCLLLGVSRANATVIDSRQACARLQDLIEAAAARKEPVHIQIENPASWPSATGE